jgi:hypothetical protein
MRWDDLSMWTTTSARADEIVRLQNCDRGRKCEPLKSTFHYNALPCSMRRMMSSRGIICKGRQRLRDRGKRG